MKFKTVKEGEQVLIRNYMGEGRLVVGPKRVYLFRERLEKLSRYTANRYEYLAVKDINGFVKHVPGPIEMFCNPLINQNINKQCATKIDANHMIVVYKKKDKTVERRIVQGPTVFIPEAEEWLHEFVWHGPDPQNERRMKPLARKFTQLPCIPEQFYYDINEVRTTDDTIITVKLMIFHELKDVIKMLEATHDPIADMINAITSDIITFVGKSTYPEFLSNTTKLSSLNAYPQLTERAVRMGYNITQVVYRGYKANEQLQKMHDSSIQSRTQLRLNKEIEEQKQKLTDFKLKKEQARTELRQEIDRSKQVHTQKVEILKQKQEIETKDMNLNSRIDIEEMSNKATLEMESKKNEQKLGYLQKMSDMNVDLTSYLVTKNGAPISEEFQVVRP